MGWSFGNRTRESVIDELAGEHAAQHGITTHRKTMVGNILWAVQSQPGYNNGHKYISMAHIKHGGGLDGWGYKGAIESMGPYVFDCPLSYLDEVEMPAGCETSLRWREMVRKHHAVKKARRAFLRSVAVGQEIATRGLLYPERVRIVSMQPLYGVDIENGIRYRLSTQQLDHHIEG